MKNNVFVNTFCRAVAIASILFVPTTVLANPFLEEFWDQAWGLDFVLDRSGMLLEDSGSDAWQVLVIDTDAEDPFVAEGNFLEADRLLLESMALTQEELDEAGIISFDHYIVAGSITGSTCFESALYGFATVVILPGAEAGDDPVPVHGFTPVGLADDVATAVAMAHNYWDAFEFPGILETYHYCPAQLMWWPSEAGSGPRAHVGRDCAKEENLCKKAAHKRFTARNKEIEATTLAAMAACGLAVCRTLGLSSHKQA